jgi:hypothetical protein
MGTAERRVLDRVVGLPATAAAPVEARRAVAAIPGCGGQLGYKLLLLVSEAVTAAVMAGTDVPDAGIELRVHVDRDRVRVDVCPSDPRHPIALSPYAEQIFRRTDSRWAIDREGDGRIWFELERGDR